MTGNALHKSRCWALLLIAVGVISFVGLHLASAAPDAVLTLDPAQKFQTISGWQAVAQAGHESPMFSLYQDELLDMAVFDLGINQLMASVTNNSGGTGFSFASLDSAVERVVIPMQQRLSSKGERLYVVVKYVGFKVSVRLNDQPDVYAQNVLATFQHLQSKYGFAPDAWDVINEPDLSGWSAAQVASALIATGDLLKTNGYSPAFIAPSTTDMGSAVIYFDEMVRLPGVLAYLSDISYHRYSGVSPQHLQTVAARAKQYGKRTAMTEHIASGYQDLHLDLDAGMNSTWEQFTLAYPTADNGAQYYWIDTRDPKVPKVVLANQTKFLRQYFKFIRGGAVRIQASTTTDRFAPLAFINPDGGYVLVVKATGGGAFSIRGLPADRYGVKYTTADDYDHNLPDQPITIGQELNASIPAPGVITIYATRPESSRPIAAPTGTTDSASVSTRTLDRTPTSTATAPSQLPTFSNVETPMPSPTLAAIDRTATIDGNPAWWLLFVPLLIAGGFMVRGRVLSKPRSNSSEHR